MIKKWVKVGDIWNLSDMIEDLEMEVESGELLPEEVYDRNHKLTLILEYSEEQEDVHKARASDILR